MQGTGKLFNSIGPGTGEVFLYFTVSEFRTVFITIINKKLYFSNCYTLINYKIVYYGKIWVGEKNEYIGIEPARAKSTKYIL